MHARLAALVFLTTAAAQEKVDFATQIRPIFEQRCTECHGAKEQEADLRLDTRSGAFPENEKHWVIRPGKPAESELLKRIKLPASDADVMPAEGDPLPADQIALIERWITEGAVWPDEGGATAKPPTHEPAPVEQIVIELDAAQREAVDAAAETLRARGAVVGPIARDLLALDVNLSLLRPKAGDEEVALLAGVAPALVWLNVSRSDVTDAGLATLARCTKLRRLHLAETAVGDAGIAHLRGLSELRFLNLFGTKVTDRGLATLQGLARLEKLFLWQTQVTDAGVAALQRALPKLVIDRGGYADEILKVAAELAAAETKEKAARPDGVVNSKCPVSGEAVDAKVTLVHEGRTVAFCCANCRAKFEADPAKFAPSLPPSGEGDKKK